MHRIHAIAFAAVGALSLVGAGAHAAPPLAPPPVAPPIVTGGDKLTLQQLHQANQTAIQMARLASTKGSTRSVRDYARTLIDEHTLAERKLDEYLRRRGSDLATLGSATSADADHELLATKSGPDFDRAFAEQMVRDHQTVLDRLSSAVLETSDDVLRLLYEQMTTTERAHKRGAEILLAATVRS
ncbi:MAG TPA: DUF4142 domain-containing protein [Polyangia bacterium]|jgi:putative membrane protein|nr:DUF4142 domain-containing protein [Polyangia bacterium]